MYRYNRTEFDRVLEFVRGLYEPRTPEGLRDHLLPALRALIPVMFAANASFEVEAPLQGRTQRRIRLGLGLRSLMQFSRDMCLRRRSSSISSAPVVSNSRDGPTCNQCHNFCARRFTTKCIAPAEIRDCCTLFLHDQPNRIEFVGVGLHKQIPDAHRDMLVSISPHVHQAFRLAHSTSALIELATMKGDPNRPERGILAIDLNGTITMETAAATRALEKFFPNRTRRGLPESTCAMDFAVRARLCESPPTFRSVRRPSCYRAGRQPPDCSSAHQNPNRISCCSKSIAGRSILRRCRVFL